MGELASTRDLIVIGAVLGAALLVGLAARFVLGHIAVRAQNNRWSWDDAVWVLLHDLALPLALAAALWTTALTLNLTADQREAAGRVLVAVLVLVATLAAARFVSTLVAAVTLTSSEVAQSATIFVTIAKVVVLAIGFLILLQSVGISVTPLLTALGVGGLAVALALQDTLANLFAGVHILASKKVQRGDYVRLDSGEDGYIVDINWRNTSIRQIPGNVVIVPNAKFADAIVTNYHRPAQEMSVLVEVGVSYNSDLAHVEDVTVDVARQVMHEVEGGVSGHKPFMRYHTFGESSIDFTVILRAREFTDQYVVVHEFVKRLHERYRAEDIEIPFPQRNVIIER